MAQTRKQYLILPVTLAAGLAGAAARLALYGTAVDEKGLLPRFHPLQVTCLLLTAAMAVYLFLSLRQLEPSDDRERNYPVTPLRLPGQLAAFGLLLACGFQVLGQYPASADATQVAVAFVCAGCLLLRLICNLLGKRTPYLFYGILCVCFLMDMLIRYRDWSGNPQLPDYCFHVAASVALILTAYHRTAFEVGMGSRRRALLCTMMALFLCLLSMVGPDPWEFYLGGACWALSELPAPNPAPIDSAPET